MTVVQTPTCCWWDGVLVHVWRPHVQPGDRCQCGMHVLIDEPERLTKTSRDEDRRPELMYQD